MNEHLDADAALLGFYPAPRAGRDETRYAFPGAAHIAFVTVRHELHRGVRDAPMERAFRDQLRFARAMALDPRSSPTRTYLAGGSAGTLRLESKIADPGALAAADAVEFSDGPTAFERELDGIRASSELYEIDDLLADLRELPETEEPE